MSSKSNNIKTLMLSWRYNRESPSLENAVGNRLAEKGYLEKLLTKGGKRYNKNLERSHHIRGLLANLWHSKVSLKIKKPSNYKIAKQLFLDRVGTRELKNCNVVYTGMNGFPQTIKKAKEMGIPTVVSHLVNHPIDIRKVLDEEYSKFNFLDKYHVPHSEGFDQIMKSRLESLEYADSILVGSTATLNSNIASNIPRSKMKIIPAGINVNEFYSEKKKEDIFRVICVGHGVLTRGINYLVEAWQNLSLDSAELIIIGEMDPRFLQMYEDSSSIIFKGILPFEKVKEYYAKSSLMVHPAISDAGPRSVLEGMASSLPIVISDLSGYSEIITNNQEGFVIPSYSSASIEDRISFFYNNRNEIKRMGVNSQNTVKKFTLKNYADNVIKAIEEVVN